MIQPPAASEFPGTGASGNGIAPQMTTQQHWLENMKENCMFCHQLGDKATRELLTHGQQCRGLVVAHPDGAGERRPCHPR